MQAPMPFYAFSSLGVRPQTVLWPFLQTHLGTASQSANGLRKSDQQAEHSATTKIGAKPLREPLNSLVARAAFQSAAHTQNRSSEVP